MSSITLMTSMNNSTQPPNPQTEPTHTLPPIQAPYYHPSYPLTTPGVDIILCSSDLISCRFAICSSRFDSLQAHELISSHHPISIDFEFPLIKLNQTKEVIEIILLCLDLKMKPDLTIYTFDQLVSALEAVASREELAKVERLCLLAIGTYYKTKPIQVFALAEIYEYDWMARLASEYTLSLDINLPIHKCLLSIEAFNALNELHSFRRIQARDILDTLTLPIYEPHHPTHCNPTELIKFWNRSLTRLKRIVWNSRANLNLNQILLTEL
ncbi:uncharacterized protein MELLADRAFT_103808 [Melampsora larici-populina 98AG31]|uniref:BTB domain-containing protein n=1 Tax=Melampsora larici-populina (strain 98AG31 / pathotype 3-4-7) TaxID=747676 RepID=F4RCI8_MELLP|nr:uncharacterized protein MELLADRAFT_103808 [Melampsora larici-populina 98AG31]EGG09957.1 hypothetical protein MELLADRAFT_103808 [Melampsora larici-populina 98AG31]